MNIYLAFVPKLVMILVCACIFFKIVDVFDQCCELISREVF